MLSSRPAFGFCLVFPFPIFTSPTWLILLLILFLFNIFIGWSILISGLDLDLEDILILGWMASNPLKPNVVQLLGFVNLGLLYFKEKFYLFIDLWMGLL